MFVCVKTDVVGVACLLNYDMAGIEESRVRTSSLQDRALLLLLLPRQQRGAGGVLEHLPHAFVRLGRALEVLLRANLLADVFGLWRW